MPTEQDRPGMFASRNGPWTQFPYSQPSERGPPVGNQREEPHRHKRDQGQSQRMAQEPQGPYHAYTPNRAQSPPPAYSTAPSRYAVVQRTSAQQFQTAKKARRTSRMVNGVVYAGSVVSEPPGELSRILDKEARKGLMSDRASSYLMGCVPSDPALPLARHRNDQQQTSPYLAVPGQHHHLGPSSPSQLPQIRHGKPLPPPPPIREVTPPGEERWRITNPDLVVPVPLCPKDHQTEILGHNELFFGDAALASPPPEDFEGCHPPPTIHQTPQVYPTRLGTSIYYGMYSGLQSLPELDATNSLEDEQGHHRGTLGFEAGLPVLPEIESVMAGSVFEINGEQQRPHAMWYDHFRESRTWDFDETMEARYKVITGSGPASGELGDNRE